MSDEYIALAGRDQYGKFSAMLITPRPAPEIPTRVRRIEHTEELEALKQEWGVNEVRGDALLKIQPRPQDG